MSKLNLLFLSLFLLLAFHTSNAQTATAKRAPLFENLQSPNYSGVVVWCREFNVLGFSQANIKALPASQIKQMKAPSGLKRLIGPIQMQCEKKCMQIDLAKECGKDSLLLWNDANKDGKLNPKRELKCYHTKGKGKCGIIGKELNCK